MDSNNVSGAARTGLKAGRTAIRVSAGLAVMVAGAAIRAARKRAGSSQTSEAPAPPASTGSTPTSNGTQPTPAAATPPAAPAPTPTAPAASKNGSAPEDEPSTPLTREEADAKTIDDTDEVVAEFSEPGAEDGAGSSVELDAPWEGYDSANAQAIGAKLADADAATVAVVELYEQAHKNRKTVLEAAQRRLKHLSPSE